MTTKMKGLLKGLRYISQIFDEEKEPEMKIGFPTDVKHVAHIGWDGPAVDSPSWMKEFKSPTAFQSAPLSSPRDPREDSEIKWVSEDSKRGKNKPAAYSPVNDLPELPKSSTRTTTDSPRKKELSTKSRQSRKQQSKDSSDGGGSHKSNRQLQEPGDSPQRSLPDIPKKSRRKKSKESNSAGGSRSRCKNTAPNGTYSSPYSDPGPDRDDGSISRGIGSRLSPVPSIDDEENECRVNSKVY